MPRPPAHTRGCTRTRFGHFCPDPSRPARAGMHRALGTGGLATLAGAHLEQMHGRRLLLNEIDPLGAMRLRRRASAGAQPTHSRRRCDLDDETGNRADRS